MMKRIISVVEKFLPTPKPIRHLGRWEHRISDAQRDTKITWANSDHCGDILCGNPKNIVENIENLHNSTKKQ